VWQLEVHSTPVVFTRVRALKGVHSVPCSAPRTHCTVQRSAPPHWILLLIGAFEAAE